MTLLSLLLLLQCNLQLFTITRAAFSFTVNVLSHSTSVCSGGDCTPCCETVFPSFCLRDPRISPSVDITDCPLGNTSGLLDHGTEGGSRIITSDEPWPGGFQLFFQAFDDGSPDSLEDIFINRNLTANSSILAISHQGSRVSINMTFEVACLSNYYGDECLVFCKAWDKDNDLECDCPAGYTGEFCTEDINECFEPAAICPGNSTCEEDSLNFFQCRCNPGFEGEDCTETIQSCDSITCANGGMCVPEDPLRYECVCMEGYTGHFCEFDIDECLSSSDKACSMESLCINEEPGFRCVNQTPNSFSNIIIGSAISGIVVITILVVVVTFFLLTRRRRKPKVSRNRNKNRIHHSRASQLDLVRCVSLSPENRTIQESMTANPLYGRCSRAATSYRGDPSSQNRNPVREDEVRANIQKASLFDPTDGVKLFTNIAYTRSTPQGARNPFFSCSAVPPPNSSQASYDSVELVNKDDDHVLRHLDSPFPLPQETTFEPESSAELSYSYAAPATIRCVGVEISRYSKLKYLPAETAARQASLYDSGYTVLETQS